MRFKTRKLNKDFVPKIGGIYRARYKFIRKSGNSDDLKSLHGVYKIKVDSKDTINKGNYYFCYSVDNGPLHYGCWSFLPEDFIEDLNEVKT